MCQLSKNLEASTSWDPKGLSRPVMGLLYLYEDQCKRNKSGGNMAGFFTVTRHSLSKKVYHEKQNPHGATAPLIEPSSLSKLFPVPKIDT
jgi:hypothetical protein